MRQPAAKDDAEIATARAITCVVADDHPAIVSFIPKFLEQRGVEVVAVAATGEQALAAIVDHSPDVALVDVKMPGLSGIEVARAASRRGVATATVVYTGFAERFDVERALEAGARGVIQKEAPLDDLVYALQIVAGGGAYVDPVLGGEVLNGRTKTAELTERERQVLELLSNGFSFAVVGERLGISPETVRVHLRNARSRLDATTRTHAVATAIRASYIS